ncbi:MAG: radical SAM protein [Halobacteriaceae archaeon]
MVHASGGGPDLGESPLVLTWEVTQACALECDHCRAEAVPGRDPDELTTAQARSFIDDLTGFEDPPIFVFSGGDPLERPDLFDLVEYAVDAGLRTGVTPAPTPSLDRAVIERFADLGVARVALSLDGDTPDRHDAFRGEAGSFETVMRAARAANEAGLSIQINTTVTADTVTALPGIADIVEDLGAAMWEVFFLVPVGRGLDLEQLAPAATVPVMEWLYRRQRDAPFRVVTVEAPHYRRVAHRVEAADSGRSVRVGSTRAGKGFLFVSHTGEIYPSGFLPATVGNVVDDDVVDRYREAQLLERLRDADTFSGACGTCEFRSLCGGSRSRAFAATGDPFESDPLCPFPPHGAST